MGERVIKTGHTSKGVREEVDKHLEIYSPFGGDWYYQNKGHTLRAPRTQFPSSERDYHIQQNTVGGNK